jgi:hypothetical protein
MRADANRAAAGPPREGHQPYAPARREGDSLPLEAQALGPGALRAPQADRAAGPHHAMPGQGAALGERVQRIAHVAGVTRQSRQGGHLTVGRHAAARDRAHHLEQAGEDLRGGPRKSLPRRHG